MFRLVRCYSTTPKAVSTAVTNLSLATRQQLYITDPVTPGSPFFLPHGTRILNRLVSFMKWKQRQYGFEEVVTPLIYRKQLWEQSGHWDNYQEDMFRVEGMDLEKEAFGLKPMNCPGHCMIFDKFERSYQELPLRLSDFSSLHRNESSGSLSGLTRVRRFHQDDGHIFCTTPQIQDEITNTLKMIDEVYQVFNIPGYKLVLSTRPDEYIGDIEHWTQAESTLRQALESSGKPWTLNEGDGAFYGPKIDVILEDNLGKEHQAATIQLDFQLPQRFKLHYQSNENTLEQPIMIHRAVFGSLERFLAILIDHYDGVWPFWLSPRQALVIPVSERHTAYAQQVVSEINQDEHWDEDVKKFHIDIDIRSEPVGARIKEALKKGYTYILMIGDKEVEQGMVSIRHRTVRQAEVQSSEDVRNMFIELERQHK